MFVFFFYLYGTNNVLSHFSRSSPKTNPQTCVTAPNDRNLRFDLVTSDDLDLTQGKKQLRMVI